MGSAVTSCGSSEMHCGAWVYTVVATVVIVLVVNAVKTMLT